MTLNRTAKILVGLGTAIVVLFPFLMAALIIMPAFMMPMMGGREPDPAIFPVFFSVFFLIFPLMFLFIFLQIGLMVFYIIHIIKNNAASELFRILSGVGLYIMPYLAMPFYYFVYILPETPPDWALAAPAVKA